MPVLQKINLGTAPDGKDGDTVRSGNVKVNANVDVLATQAALISSAPVTTNTVVLDNTYLGRRVTLQPNAAATLTWPKASTCGADSVILIINASAYTVTHAVQAGDSFVNAVTFAPWESALVTTDGVSKWSVLIRGRAIAAQEQVSGNLSVSGALTAGGPVFGPTAPGGTNSTQLASTAFVMGALPGSLTAYTPLYSAPSGSFGAGGSATGAYFKLGKLVFVQITVNIPAAGTATGLSVQLPFVTYNSALYQILAGRENAVTGKMLQGTVGPNSSTMTVFNFDNSSPVVSGGSYILSGCYYAA